MSDKPKDDPERDASRHKRLVIPPWAWLFLQGVATVLWLFAIGWGAIYVASWLLG